MPTFEYDTFYVSSAPREDFSILGPLLATRPSQQALDDFLENHNIYVNCMAVRRLILDNKTEFIYHYRGVGTYIASAQEMNNYWSGKENPPLTFTIQKMCPHDVKET
jgi:hypothetical protein